MGFFIKFVYEVNEPMYLSFYSKISTLRKIKFLGTHLKEIKDYTCKSTIMYLCRIFFNNTYAPNSWEQPMNDLVCHSKDEL